MASAAPAVDPVVEGQQVDATPAATSSSDTSANNTTTEQEQSVEAVEQQVAGMSLEDGSGSGSGSEGELHRACAEGNLDEVRSVLSRGLDGLEVPDTASGCTPLVLAIRYNHHDVVRELLSAGAMVPPPGLSADPHMNALLYPQPMYGMPPFMPMGGPPDFYAQQQQQQQQQGQYYSETGGPRRMSQGPRPDGMMPGMAMMGMDFAANNLPPLDVAKTIPCRNFPQCKYGNNCAFFHPRHQPPFAPQQQQQQQYYPYAPAGPNGYEHAYPAYMPGPAYFDPSAAAFNPSFQHQQHQQSQQHQQQPSSQHFQDQQSASTQHQQHDNTTSTNNTEASDSAEGEIAQEQQQHQQQQQQQPMSAFIPSFQPAGMALSSPPPPPPFGVSPMSPAALAASGGLPLPPSEAFYATSPPVFVPALGGRQSFSNASKPYMGHGKKPSFSGGPRPWAQGPGRASISGPGGLGTWKDGVPPPCAFFAQGKCRNGEFCKFPHLDAEGTDCRHPDVVRGLVAPLPSLSRQNRNMRLSNGFAPFNPAFQQQQHMAFMRGTNGQQPQHQANGESVPAVEGAEGSQQPVVEEEALDISEEEESPAQPAATTASEEKPATEVAGASQSTDVETPAAEKNAVPAPVQAATPAPVSNGKPAQANGAGAARSASHPGVQRAQANGSRSHSPAGNGAHGGFHGHGHPNMPGQNQRRSHSRPNGFGHPGHPGNNPHHPQNQNGGNRSVSAGTDKAQQQRLPRADEFPVLGNVKPNGGGGAAGASVGGKTAAQVLAQPAPPKPVKPATTASPAAPAVASDDNKSESGKSDNALSVGMESEAGTDAVLISVKSSTTAPTTTTTSPGSASPVKPSMSFASVASSVTPSSTAPAASSLPAPAMEASPVAVSAA